MAMTIEPNWSPIYILFAFIAGFVGDVITHIFAEVHKRTGYGFGAPLMAYYDSFSNWVPKSLEWPTTKAVVYGGLFGGIAVIFGVILINLFIMALHKYAPSTQTAQVAQALRPIVYTREGFQEHESHESEARDY